MGHGSSMTGILFSNFASCEPLRHIVARWLRGCIEFQREMFSVSLSDAGDYHYDTLYMLQLHDSKVDNSSRYCQRILVMYLNYLKG